MSEANSGSQTQEVKGWFNKSCIIPGRLDGKLAIVTGSNTGIGLVTAAELARRGCRVIMACRNIDKANKAKEEILKKYSISNPDSTKIDVADESVRDSLKPVNDDQLIIEHLQLDSFQSIREFATKMANSFQKIDYLINNAGQAPDCYGKSVDGYEHVMAVNHLGHFLLTELLLPQIKQAAPSKIIILSSTVHSFGRLHKPDLCPDEKDYDADRVYCDSKLANTMHARELSKRLEGTNVTVISLHPGVVSTELARDVRTIKRKIIVTFSKLVQISPWQGAQTTMFTVLSDKLVSGGYYSNCALAQPTAIALNDSECKWLYDKSAELVGLMKETL